METDKGIRLQNFVEFAVSHLLCSVTAFFCRLEDQHYIAAELVFNLGKNLGTA